MPFLDFILNLVGLLLWCSWRLVGLSESARPGALSLASTLKRAEPRRAPSWPPLLGVLALLLLRGLFYWLSGPAMHWTPMLSLGAVTLHFRVERLGLAVLFSTLSFLRWLAVLYAWLLLLAMVTRRLADPGPVRKILDAQVGPLARFPVGLQLLLVPVLATLLWWMCHRPLSWLGLVALAPSETTVWRQGLALGLGVCLTWRYPIVVLLAVHAFNSQVYVGRSVWWDFAAACGRHLLQPFRGLNLRMGRIDLAPLVAIALVLIGAHYAERGLALLFERPVG